MIDQYNITKQKLEDCCYFELGNISNNPPLTIYLPSEIMLKKIMNVCSKVFQKN